MKQQHPSSTDLQRNRNAVEQDLQEARDAHAKAAYAAAVDRDDETARERLVAAKQRIDTLEGERMGLTAAQGEAARIERQAVLEAEARELQATEREALAAVTGAQQAFQVLVEQTRALGEAYRAFTEKNSAMRGFEANLRIMRNPEDFYSPTLRPDPLLDGLLWQELGQRDLKRCEVVMDSGGTRTPDRPLEVAVEACERVRHNIRKSVAERLANIEASIEASERKARAA